jgi:hypothetical protein
LKRADGVSGMFWLHMNRGGLFGDRQKTFLTCLNSAIIMMGLIIVSSIFRATMSRDSPSYWLTNCYAPHSVFLAFTQQELSLHWVWEAGRFHVQTPETRVSEVDAMCLTKGWINDGSDERRRTRILWYMFCRRYE